MEVTIKATLTRIELDKKVFPTYRSVEEKLKSLHVTPQSIMGDDGDSPWAINVSYESEYEERITEFPISDPRSGYDIKVYHHRYISSEHPEPATSSDPICRIEYMTGPSDRKSSTVLAFAASRGCTVYRLLDGYCFRMWTCIPARSEINMENGVKYFITTWTH